MEETAHYDQNTILKQYKVGNCDNLLLVSLSYYYDCHQLNQCCFFFFLFLIAESSSGQS